MVTLAAARLSRSFTAASRPLSAALARSSPFAAVAEPSTSSAATSAPRAAAGARSYAGVSGVVSSLLHGSEDARREGEAVQQQHSKLVGRGKYVHEVQKHHVRPDRTQEYKEAIERYYGEMNKSDEFDCRLSGSWEVSVGEIDTFVHIWEYKGFPGFESVKRQVKESRGHLETFNHEIMPLVFSRENQLCQEFAFWQTARPQEKGGIYELRSYQLQPGALLEWEHEWRVGLEARISSGHHPIGAWFSQIGRLHEVHHMWHYESLEHRRQMREKAWEIESWSSTVHKTVKLAQSMQTSILQPLPFSPLR